LEPGIRQHAISFFDRIVNPFGSANKYN